MTNQPQIYENGRTSLTAVEAFTGPGGLSLGLRSAGFHTIVAIEKVASCIATYKRNFPATTTIHADVRHVSVDSVREIVQKTTGKPTVDLVAGGPPCETFSTAGPGIRHTRDHRDHLFEDLIRIAKGLSARYILIENIPGIQTKKGVNGEKAGIFREILATLEDAGFTHYKWKVLNSADFGVPQFRERLFIIATSSIDDHILFPKQTHGPGRSFPWITVQDALDDLPLLVLQREVDPRRARKARKGGRSGAAWGFCAPETMAYGTRFHPKPPKSGSACPILCALRVLRGSHVRLRVVILETV